MTPLSCFLLASRTLSFCHGATTAPSGHRAPFHCCSKGGKAAAVHPHFRPAGRHCLPHPPLIYKAQLKAGVDIKRTPAAPFSSLAAEKSFRCPFLSSGMIVTLSLSAGVSKKSLGLLRLIEVSFLSKRRSEDRRTPVEEGDRKIPQGVRPRKLEISSTASLPSCSGVFCHYQQ